MVIFGWSWVAGRVTTERSCQIFRHRVECGLLTTCDEPHKLTLVYHLRTPEDDLQPSLTGDRGQTQSRTHRGQTNPQISSLSRGRRRTTPPQKPISGRRPSLPTLASSQHCYSPSPLNAPTPLGHPICISSSSSLLSSVPDPARPT